MLFRLHSLLFVISLLLLQTPIVTASPPLRAAALAGVARFQKQCTLQQLLMPRLRLALRNRDLSAARAAYVAARPPYEQIETLANAFPDLDADIDARPYAFRFGEHDPSFKGFHLIERALFRDNRITFTIVLAADELSDTVDDLCRALKDRKRYSPAVVLEGAVALAFEVPAKKVASEEETWSDLSLMIFRNNVRGIWTVVHPFLNKVPRKTAQNARSAYRAFRHVINDIDPAHPFTFKGGAARPYSDVTIAERKRIIDVGYRFAEIVEKVQSDVLSQLPLVDAEEEEEEEEKSVRLNDAKLQSATNEGVRYFNSQCSRQQRLLEPLAKALRSRDVKAAKKRYAEARQPYEQIEVLAGDFSDQDLALDGRPYAYARGERDDEWRGFHLVERALFRDGDLGVALRGLARVKRDVDDLCEILTKGDGFTASSSFDGMITLAYEVPAKKISSEEETWSDLSVMIFRENIKGIWSVFRPFQKYVGKREFEDVMRKYLKIRTLIENVVDRNNDWNVGSDFIPYSQVPVYQRKNISDVFYDLGRALVKARESVERR